MPNYTVKCKEAVKKKKAVERNRESADAICFSVVKFKRRELKMGDVTVKSESEG